MNFGLKDQKIYFWPVYTLKTLIAETRLFKYTENFTTKTENFQIKHFDIFHISAQNIDSGYLVEPLTGTHNLYIWAEIRKIMYTPVKFQFYYIKVGVKGANII